MPPLPLPLSRVLGADANVAAWDARRRREETLTALVRHRLPRPLADRVRVVDAQGADLVLGCDGGAIAALVRQRSPEILAALQGKGWQLTGIRVRVQVRATAPAPNKTERNQVDKTALQPVTRLARELPAGPLKASLERLLRRLG